MDYKLKTSSRKTGKLRKKLFDFFQKEFDQIKNQAEYELLDKLMHEIDATILPIDEG